MYAKLFKKKNLDVQNKRNIRDLQALSGIVEQTSNNLSTLHRKTCLSS